MCESTWGRCDLRVVSALRPPQRTMISNAPIRLRGLDAQNLSDLHPCPAVGRFATVRRRKVGNASGKPIAALGFLWLTFPAASLAQLDIGPTLTDFLLVPREEAVRGTLWAPLGRSSLMASHGSGVGFKNMTSGRHGGLRIRGRRARIMGQGLDVLPGRLRRRDEITP